LIAALAAILKTVLDARRDRGVIRQTAEEQVRVSLMGENDSLRREIGELRDELAAARREMNRIARDSERRLRECESRAVGFQRELAEVKAELKMLRNGGHAS
jgi:predicted RNase H-like nuclease (RuvC/YqgF family)